jgi:hypothetical protein
MSWSFEHTGTKEAVKAATAKTLDKIAANYGGEGGSEEAKDILSAKARILSIVDALQMGSDGYAEWNGAKVSGSGSHSTSGSGVTSASCTYSVQRVALVLDAPPVAAT